MARPKTAKEKTHPLFIQIPANFWVELEDFYKQRKSYNSYAEMVRHLMKIGLNVLLREDANGKLGK